MTRNDANGDQLPKYTWTPPDSHGGRFLGRYAGTWIGVRGGDLPCEIRIRLGTTGRGVLYCTGLRIGAPDGKQEYEVTARMLRDIRIGNILRAIREGAASRSGTKLDEQVPNNVFKISYGELIAGTAVPLKNLKVKRGRKGLDPETLRRTAESYLKAVSEGATQPLAVTAQEFDIHPSTVWRRLQNAWKRFPELKPKED